MFEQLALATPSVVIEVLLTLLMTFFMVESRVRLRRRLLAQSTLPGTSVKAARVVRDVQDRVASYILTVAVINFGMGAIVALGAWALDFEAPAVLAPAVAYFAPCDDRTLVVLTLTRGGGTETVYSSNVYDVRRLWSGAIVYVLADGALPGVGSGFVVPEPGAEAIELGSNVQLDTVEPYAVGLLALTVTSALLVQRAVNRTIRRTVQEGA